MSPETAEAPVQPLTLRALESGPLCPGRGCCISLPLVPPHCCFLAPGMECQIHLFSVVSGTRHSVIPRAKCSS